MRKKIAQILLPLALLVFINGLYFVPQALAQQQSGPKQDWQTRCKNFLGNFNINGDASKNPFSWVNTDRYCTAEGLILWLVRMAISLAGTAAVVFIVIGGYQYLSSAGNEEAAEKGRKTLVNAIIGLVVVIMSFVIVRIVTDLLTSGK